MVVVTDYSRTAVSGYLAEQFPRRQEIADGIWAQDARAMYVTGKVATPTLVGQVFEHLVVLDLGGWTAYRHLDGALPDDAVDLIHAAVRPPAELADCPAVSGPAEETLRAAWYLAYHQDCLHKLGRSNKALCRETLAGQTSRPFQGDTFPAALSLVHDLYAAYLHDGRDRLRSLTPVFGAVEVVPNRAYADLIAGGALVEIKTGHVDADAIALVVDQVLEYVLLDVSDTWHLSHIAIYLARAGRLYHQALPSWLAELSGNATPLAQHRNAVAKLPGTLLAEAAT